MRLSAPYLLRQGGKGAQDYENQRHGAHVECNYQGRVERSYFTPRSNLAQERRIGRVVVEVVLLGCVDDPLDQRVSLMLPRERGNPGEVSPRPRYAQVPIFGVCVVGEADEKGPSAGAGSLLHLGDRRSDRGDVVGNHDGQVFDPIRTARTIPEGMYPLAQYRSARILQRPWSSGQGTSKTLASGWVCRRYLIAQCYRGDLGRV